MILRLFKSTGFKGLLVNLILISLLWTVSFLRESAVTNGETGVAMPAYALITSYIKSSRILFFLAFGFFLLLSYLIVHLNSSLFFLQERTYLPSLLYVIFCSVFAGSHSMNPAIPAALFLVPATRRIMDAYRKNGTAFCFFDAALLTGTGILFFADLIWYGLILVIGVIILRGYNLKEMMLSITGLTVPSILLAGYLYVFGADPGVITESFISNITARHDGPELTAVKLIPAVVCLLILFYSLLSLIPRINNMKIRSGKIFTLFVWILIISVVILIFSPGSLNEIIYLSGIPAAYIITFQVLNSRSKTLNEVMVITLLLSALGSQLLSFF